MSLTSQRPDINSFKDLATDPGYQPTTIKGTFTERIFLVNIGFKKFQGCHDVINKLTTGGRSGNDESDWR